MIKKDENWQSRTEVLIEALPYIQKFRGHTFVIKYGGSAMEDEHVVERLLKDVVFLEAVGINPVVVHGGGKAITQKLHDAGLRSSFVNGLRVTDAQSIGLVQETLDGQVNPKIVQTLKSFGGHAKGFSGKDVFQAKKLPLQQEGNKPPVDIGFVGEVVSVQADAIRADIAEEIVSVVSPLALDADEQVLNVNADLAAGALAAELKATKMIYLSDVLGIMRDRNDPESLIPSVTREMIELLIKDEVIEGGMIPKVQSACAALEAGVEKVHFIDGRIPHALLLEVFTTAGIGTEILP